MRTHIVKKKLNVIYENVLVFLEYLEYSVTGCNNATVESPAFGISRKGCANKYATHKTK